MALFRIDHTSETVKVNLPLYLCVPSPTRLHEKTLADFKVLYLLHGLGDDGSAWQRYTNIEVLARELNLVVIMPTAGRSLYADQANGQAYFSYLTDELPGYLKSLFRFNLSRENTLIAGISMGGYGAFKAAFLRPDLYFAAASFSGMLSVDILNKIEDEGLKNEFSLVFGGFKNLLNSDNDPMAWLQRAASQPSAFPRLFAACGTEDDLLPLNRLFRHKAQALGVPLDYLEEAGGHDWFFWNRQVERFLRSQCQVK